MIESIVACVFLGIGIVIGVTKTDSDYQTRCETMYADMPHNKVSDHCKAILKFKKD
jgi:hypothetical protein